MDITTGQAITSLSVTITGGLVAVMVGSMIKRVKMFAQKVDTLEKVVSQMPGDILTTDKHTDLCRIRELETKQRLSEAERKTRDLVEEILTAFSADMKDHINEVMG